MSSKENELVQRLRETEPGWVASPLELEAADTIEAQAKRIEEYKKENQTLERRLGGVAKERYAYYDENIKLSKRIAELEAELDRAKVAMVEALKAARS